MKHSAKASVAIGAVFALALFSGCMQELPMSSESEEPTGFVVVEDTPLDSSQASDVQEPASSDVIDEPEKDKAVGDEHAAREAVGIEITEDYRDIFNHGEKGAEFQKYIVLHDT